MKTLDDVMFKHASDKAAAHHVKGHNYCELYEPCFEPLRKEPVMLLEIGVGSGNAHRGWLEYFSQAVVFGIDIVHHTNPWNTPDADRDMNQMAEITRYDGFGRYTFMHASQSDETFWKCLAADYGDSWTIIIDDGSHMIDDVVNGFKYAWRLVRSGGFYCIEDLGVGGTPGSVFLKPSYPTHMQFVHSLMERADVDSFYFAGELLILRKK